MFRPGFGLKALALAWPGGLGFRDPEPGRGPKPGQAAARLGLATAFRR